MGIMLDGRAAELLVSKLCHDLVSPIGAIHNGIELIEEFGETDDALQLIKHSADQSARRLKLFRLAYGAAGSEGNLPEKEFADTLKNYYGEGKIVLDWPYGAAPEWLAEKTGGLKTLMNIAMLAGELASGQGRIELRTNGTAAEVQLYAAHPQWRESADKALLGDIPVEDLNPRNIHAYYTGMLARHYGLGFSFVNQDGGIVFTITLLP